MEAVKIVPEAVVRQYLRKELTRQIALRSDTDPTARARLMQPSSPSHKRFSPKARLPRPLLPSRDTIRRTIDIVGQDLLGRNLHEQFQVFLAAVEPADLEITTFDALVQRTTYRLNHLASEATFLVVRHTMIKVVSIDSRSILPEEPVTWLEQSVFESFVEELGRQVADRLVEPTDPLLPLSATKIHAARHYGAIRDHLLRDVLRPILTNRRTA